jgi:hypothetical protein
LRWLSGRAPVPPEAICRRGSPWRVKARRDCPMRREHEAHIGREHPSKDGVLTPLRAGLVSMNLLMDAITENATCEGLTGGTVGSRRAA